MALVGGDGALRVNIMRKKTAFFAACLLGALGFAVSPAQDTLSVEHPECTYFGEKREQYARGSGVKPSPEYTLSAQTEQVVQSIGFIPGGSRTKGFEKTSKLSTIDYYLFADMQAAGVMPAAKTTDVEFIRRVTLDLTGRIPTPDRTLSFLADTSESKRGQLIDELLDKPEWVDKWTMYYGDLYKNNVRNTQVVRYEPGRNAFYKWIRDSLASNKPYDQMAREIISVRGTNSWDQGEINWLVGGRVTGGPFQDIVDQQAANVAETFLGIAHMNCILCHNGRGHLDSLSLWGKNATRYQGWGFASFLSHTNETLTRVNSGMNNSPYYWSVMDDTPRPLPDYALNTTTGNRPARQPVGNQRNVAAVYPFSGKGPAAGENYRVALAREVTADFQFARATVNYIWKEFFGRGIVDPVDQFDPARLDPDNPPPDPWTLQPSNARLLNALAQKFIENSYSLKWLMREIANSQAYQLSSSYDGEWNAAWEKLFARKMVRRLWAEEIHDAVAQSSGIIPTYNIAGFSTLGQQYGDWATQTFGPVQWAMKFPDVNGMPGGAVSAFLDNFLRGNRDDDERRSEGSVLQALGLMNDNFVMSRIRATANGGLLQRNLSRPDDQLVDTLFLNVLSRYPSDAEKSAALATLKSGPRNQKAEDLLWSLYNKVDFVFNY
jgi:hypothetical protein